MAAGLKIVVQNTPEKICDFNKRRRKDTIETLEGLLDKARKGEIDGLLFVAQCPGNHHRPGATGNYLTHPTIALGAAAKLWQALQDAAA